MGALLGSISQSGINLPKEKEINKIKPNKDQNNVVSLEVERKEPRIFEEKITPESLADEPLVLTQEVKGKKTYTKKSDNKTLSPAVRKIVVENKIDLQEIKGSGKEGRILKSDLIIYYISNTLFSIK